MYRIQNKINNKKKILFALVNDYYLFDYSKYLLNKLRDDKFEVYTIVDNKKTKNKILSFNKENKIILVPTPIRWCLNRSDSIILRILLCTAECIMLRN